MENETKQVLECLVNYLLTLEEKMDDIRNMRVDSWDKEDVEKEIEKVSQSIKFLKETKAPMKIPQYLIQQIEETGFLDPEMWFFIKHPELDYQCPYQFLKQGKVREVEDLIKKEKESLK